MSYVNWHIVESSSVLVYNTRKVRGERMVKMVIAKPSQGELRRKRKDVNQILTIFPIQTGISRKIWCDRYHYNRSGLRDKSGDFMA